MLPSITEGIPLSLLEGMACGLCPVATNVGGIPDVVTHGRDGILLPPLEPATLANTLLRLLEANDEVTRMAREAHRRVQGHSWARVAAQIENALAC